MKKNLQNQKGYSLLEVVVSLAIIAIMMVMLTNIMVISLKISAKTTARANAREELSNILASIKRDIRNSEVIKSCGGEDESALCEGILSQSGAFVWGLCDDAGIKKVCKKDDAGTIMESTPDNLNIERLIFDIGFDKTLDKRTIVVTIVGSNIREALNVKNVIQQTSISTRNYLNEGVDVGLGGGSTCGNGTVDAGEDCDKGSGNGKVANRCSALCKTITVVEPTNSLDCGQVTCPATHPFPSGCYFDFVPRISRSNTDLKVCHEKGTSDVWWKQQTTCSDLSGETTKITCSDTYTGEFPDGSNCTASPTGVIRNITFNYDRATFSASVCGNQYP